MLLNNQNVFTIEVTHDNYLILFFNRPSLGWL